MTLRTCVSRYERSWSSCIVVVLALCASMVTATSNVTKLERERLRSTGTTTTTPPSQSMRPARAVAETSSEEIDYDIIPGQYIVAFTDWTIVNATASMEHLLQLYVDQADDETAPEAVDVQVQWHYHTASLTGVTISGVWSSTLVAFLQDHPLVQSIEPDCKVSLDASTSKYWQQNPPNWGLDRIDQGSVEGIEPALNQDYTFDETGVGVIVFVVDTGIHSGHDEFYVNGNFIQCGLDAMPSDQGACYDGVGHGTYVAGIIGGRVFGVAKEVGIVSVKVFSSEGLGTVGSVLAGLDMILRSKRDNPDLQMVANLSWGAPADKVPYMLENVVNALVQEGVTVVASSGNEAADACTKYPGGLESVVTVSATDVNDRVAPYSNLGPCVTLWAPGTSITSAWTDSDHGQATLSGTSGAAAHVSGVMALILERFPRSGPDNVQKRLLELAQLDALDGIPDSALGKETQNLLVNMGDLDLM